MSRSYVAFISYKHAKLDAAIAKEVHTLIENYVIPPTLRKGARKLGVVFRDEEELPISNDLSESIQAALRASQYLIVICSPEASASPWVGREIDYFLQTHDASKVFVVLADGEPKDVFPAALTHVMNPSTGEYQEVEPLALDVRADTLRGSLKKLRERIRKLYAAMLGCSYDSLVQREKVRRMKRIMALSALMVMVASCFAAIILSKNLELSRKNEELYQATQTALKREALLLTADAEQALENNETAAALQNATDALYSSEIERPYCAPAERVLFSVLNAFGSEADTPQLLSDAVLTHHAPVASMVFSDDGSHVYSIDSYGTIGCYDAFSGDEAWSVNLPKNPRSYLSSNDPQIWFDGGSNMLLCSFQGNLAGIDAATGTTRWHHQLTTGIAQGPFFDATRHAFAFIESISVFSSTGYETQVKYQFVSLNATDGVRQREIPLPYTGTITEFVDFPSQSASGGCFTDSGRFVGTLFHTENEVYKSVLYWIDPHAATVHCIDNETYQDSLDRYSYVRTLCLNDGKAVVVSYENGIHIRCFDLTTSQLAWDSSIALHQGSRYYANSEYIFLPRTANLLIGYSNCMYLIDSADGSLITSTALDDRIVAIWPLQPGLFGYALANGYCAVGWNNSGTLRDSVLFSATLTLPRLSALIPCNQGPIQADTSNNRINSISLVPQKDGGGSLLYLAEDGLTAHVAAVLPAPAQLTPVQLQPRKEPVASFGEHIHTNPLSAALLSPTGINEDQRLVVADTTSRTYWKIPLKEATPSFARYLLTADGQGAIACGSFGGICYVGTDGTATSLSEDESIVLAVIDQTTYTMPRYVSDAAMQAADGSILSARCDGTAINTWINDQPGPAIPFPDNIRFSTQSGLLTNRMFRVGSNGLLLLSHYVSEDSEAMDSFAVYSLARRKWQLIPDEAHGTGDRLVAFGSHSPLFAVYDADACIRVYDAAAAALVRRIDTALPMDYVKKIGFLPGDKHLYAATQDGQFIVFDIETGSLVFKTMFSGYFSEDSISTWLDEHNERLYVRAGTKGICLDVRSWEQLFALGSTSMPFLFYSENSNEVCMLRHNTTDSAYELVVLPVPTTDELVQMALDALQPSR